MEQALTMAGENRKELEKVLKHYKDDSLKLKAAQFLIRNMPFHFSKIDYFLSTKGEHYVPDIRKFPDNQAVKKHCDSLLINGYTIQKETVYDIKTLHSDFLIQNIESAFQVWGKSWNKDLSFDNFCRYILPYRAENEPISNMRQVLMKHFLPMIESKKAANSLEACMIINKYLKETVQYKATGHPLYPPIEETFYARIGECDALCNLATMIMRSVGIPVVVQTTTWTRMDFGHAWCTVLHNDKFYDFSPAYVQPDIYPHTLATTRYLKPAKVYRRHFDADLSVLPETDDGYVTHLKSPLLEDATDEGELPTYPLCIPANRKATNPSGLVYLCAYNYYAWQPIAIGRREGDSCRFEQVAGRNFFLVAEAADKENLRFISAPVFTEGDGRFHTLQADTARCVAATLMRTMGEQPQILSYWDTEMNRFVPLAYCQLTDSTQRYDNIPDNALLWYRLQRQELGQRVGMLVNGLFKKTYDF